MIKLKNILENKIEEYVIYLDLDGVLCDFMSAMRSRYPNSSEIKKNREEYQKLVDGMDVKFWSDMPWMSDGKILWNFVKDMNVEILSAPADSEASVEGKKLWVRKNLSPTIKINLSKAENKKDYAAINHILIDDKPENIDGWISEEGEGILHTTAHDSIKQLKLILEIQ